jgi:hypothetical protein
MRGATQMPPDIDRAMEMLRGLARDATATAQERPPLPAPTMAELAVMPLPAAFACVRAELEMARQALRAQLLLAAQDEPATRARRLELIETALVNLINRENCLNAAARHIVEEEGSMTVMARSSPGRCVD